MIPIPAHTYRVVMWLLETAAHGQGRGSPLVHGELEESGITPGLVTELLEQPWMRTKGTNRMWAEDRDAMLDWLVEHGILSEEQRMWLDAKHALALMEG